MTGFITVNLKFITVNIARTVKLFPALRLGSFAGILEHHFRLSFACERVLFASAMQANSFSSNSRIKFCFHVNVEWCRHMNLRSQNRGWTITPTAAVLYFS
jgi:hypothetical protein